MSMGRTVTLNSGYKIPTVGYGTWQSAPGEVSAGIYTALKTGYRHIDLAKMYGNQKEAAQGIKKALQEIPGLKRENIFITSKLWNNSHLPQDVEKALDDTLGELELDYLDLYLIHFPVAFPPGDVLVPTKADNPNEAILYEGVTLSQTWKAMTELPKSKARSVGVSNFTIEHLETIISDTGVVPALNQVERHPRLPDWPLMAYCKAQDIAVTGYSAFGNNTWGEPLSVTTAEVRTVAERLSRKRGTSISPAQVLIAWAQLDGRIVIPKSVTPSRIEENFREVEIDEEAVAAINKIGEQPQRFNIPAAYGRRWDINIWNDEKEQGAKHVPVLRL